MATTGPIARLGLAVLAAALVVPRVAAAAKPTASVTFVQSSVVVAGRHFKPREHVSVKLTGVKISRAQTTASKTGSFHVSLAVGSLNMCNAYTLKIVGTLGSRFAYTHPVEPC